MNAQARLGRVTLRIVGALMGCALCVWFGCKPQVVNFPKVEPAFTGWVASETGKPLAGAVVEVNGRSVRSGNDGAFALKVGTQAEYVLAIRHPDYAEYVVASRTPLVKRAWFLTRAQITTVNPAAPIMLVDRRPELAKKKLGGAKFELPANALVDAQGKPPTGQLRAAIATLDLSSGEGPGDWGTRRADGREGFLISYGAVYLQFADAAGRVYQLRPGAAGRLTLPVLPTMRAHVALAPQTPFWYLDPRDGLWKPAGQAAYDASIGAYRGTVRHLSTINTDIAKFGGAACLAITVDPSLSSGLKLRIRYDSGGTPFGQVPTFTMNDPLNAAYRLPADTNVQLEVLNASNVVLGDVVVEDPPGTPLAGMVVNTGTAIAGGGSLWPPAPYSSCKPITLKRQLPTVELRINELPAAPLLADNPNDDYVTWGPTFALARLATAAPAAVTVVLTNDSSPSGGNLRFANHVSPWPVNTTATATSLSLSLPADGSWVAFVVAGELGSPSVSDKDAIIEAHQTTAAGALIGQKAMMVRVRKNANNLTAGERTRFLTALRTFRNSAASPNYILMQELHRLATMAGDEAHHQPAFLTWHRAFLLFVERELQQTDPSVALHYWNWDAAAPNIFTQDFMGAPGVGGATAEPQFAAANPLNGWPTDLPSAGGRVQRNTNNHALDPAGAMKPLDHPVDPSLVAQTDYGPTTSGAGVSSFSDDVEKSSGDPAHSWIGGHFVGTNEAADPLYYLLHSQIDREWAYQQLEHGRFGVVSGGLLTFPAPQHYDNAGAWNTPGNTPDPDFRQKGSYLEDGLWPWDGTTGGTALTVEWRPPNQSPTTGTNVPLSRPVVPSTAFPASARANLWPAVATIPFNRHFIDYMGRFEPLDALGYCYDDVAY